MNFLNREREMERLDSLIARGNGFGVVYGRRRIGKTRLLVEWVKRHGGVYTVADSSTPSVQRRVFAEALSERFPGFADVDYRDWRTLFARLSREAKGIGWRGPLVLDELPYLVERAPELPAVLQRWLDHEADALVVVVAGSSQHMMQGLVLSSDAPLFGRAREILEITPLSPRWISAAFGIDDPMSILETFTAWGGVPRYWELAAGLGPVPIQLDRLVLDPLGPLHREPDRLLAEELPPSVELRVLLDAIGSGAHRSSEIGGRLGLPATSLSRGLVRLQSMGLVRREIPFGDDERSSKRSLYRIADPFTRLWFRVVAPHRSKLATTSDQGRMALLERLWPQLLGEAWEDLCRQSVPRLAKSAIAAFGPWGPAARWWHKNEPEWDIVARSLDGRRLLLGEAKMRVGSVDAALRALAAREAPKGLDPADEVVRALFVVDGEAGAGHVVTGREVLGLASVGCG